MRKNYETMERRVYGLDTLNEKECGFLKRMVRSFNQNPDWNDFSNLWMKEGRKIWGSLAKKKIVELPIYNICLDLEMRLAISQGHARSPDFRDELEAIIDKKYPSRYQYCQKAQISQTTLSRVLNKKRDPSLRLLSTILESLGYELSLKKKPSELNSGATKTSQSHSGAGQSAMQMGARP
ncbi:MAG: helix-turn-helix transcriptional regulator [Acidobacteriota bacterium]|nr:helix-turn-helix transcriptional regulator [Acidobacteriota bacterium]